MAHSAFSTSVSAVSSMRGWAVLVAVLCLVCSSTVVRAQSQDVVVGYLNGFSFNSFTNDSSYNVTVEQYVDPTTFGGAHSAPFAVTVYLNNGQNGGRSTDVESFYITLPSLASLASSGIQLVNQSYTPFGNTSSIPGNYLFAPNATNPNTQPGTYNYSFIVAGQGLYNGKLASGNTMALVVTYSQTSSVKPWTLVATFIQHVFDGTVSSSSSSSSSSSTGQQGNNGATFVSAASATTLVAALAMLALLL